MCVGVCGMSRVCAWCVSGTWCVLVRSVCDECGVFAVIVVCTVCVLCERCGGVCSVCLR